MNATKSLLEGVGLVPVGFCRSLDEKSRRDGVAPAEAMQSHREADGGLTWLWETEALHMQWVAL